MVSVPLKVSSNTNYTYELKIPVINASNSASDLGIFVENPVGVWNRVNSTVTENIATLSVSNLTISMQQTGSGTLTVSFGADSTTAVLNGADFRIAFAFDTPSVGDVKVSHYSLVLDYGLDVSYTETGAATCSVGDPCISGYTCVATACQKCHASCLTCSAPNDDTACTLCAPHTDGFNVAPTPATCNSDIVTSSVSEPQRI